MKTTGVDPVSLQIGQRITTARLEAELTREELAVMVGCTSNTLRRWERGEVDPSFLSMLAVAEWTGKPIGWFAVTVSSRRRGRRV